jgi:hypothetical protein
VKAARRGAPKRDGSYRVEIQFNGTALAEVIRILYRYINPD